MKLRVAISVAIATMLVAGAIAQGQGGGRGQGRGQGGMRGGNQNSITGLLNRPDVQEELKITDEQKTKLAALRPQRGAGGAGGGAGRGNGGGGAGGAGGAGAGGARPDRAAMLKAQAEAEAKVMAILEAGQQKRVKELFVQRAGNSAILNAGIAKELGITEEQNKKIEDLQKKQTEAMMAMTEKMRNGEMDREAMTEARTKMTKTMDAELGKVLTSEQAEKLKGMKGAPFTFKDANGGN